MSDVTLEQLDRIVAAAEPDPTHSTWRDVSSPVAEEIGKLRPKADLSSNYTPTRAAYERNELWRMILDLDHQQHRAKEGKPPEKYPDYLAIPEPSREISSVLEIGWLQVFSLLLSRKYEKPVKQRFLREAFKAYSEMVCAADNTINDTVEVPSGFPLPLPFSPEELLSIHDLADRRNFLFEYWLHSNNDDCNDLRDYLLSADFRSLRTKNYVQFISDVIRDTIETENKKRGYDLFRFFPSLPLTMGLEVEVPNIYSTSHVQSLRIDPLQHLGVPVTYELPVDTIVRELPLPYSYGMHDQLKALAGLYAAHTIPENSSIYLHINIGELGSVIDEDIFYFHEAMLMADLMDMSSRHEDKEISLLGFKKGGRKSLHSDQKDGPKGLPFKQREDFTTLELRFGIDMHGDIPESEGCPAKKSNLVKCVKDSANLSAMAYALLGHRRHKLFPDNPLFQMLSEAWISFKQQIVTSQREHSEKATVFHQLYGMEGNSMKQIEEKYGELQAELVSKVNADTEMVEMYQDARSAFQALRADVRKALVPTGDRIVETIRLCFI